MAPRRPTVGTVSPAVRARRRPAGYHYRMHVHLDPLGGIAGDMFVAAILDAFPERDGGLAAALETAGLGRFGSMAREAHHDGALSGSRVVVRGPAEPHPHRSFTAIRELLESADLEPAVRRRALDIFTRLAHAEGAVHGRDPGDVTFHEVGAWDSILDIVASAWLIESMGAASWSCAPVPLGSGRVDTAHGPLPVPAPATASLLAGVPCVRDGIAGERVTPTGAAILRHLDPSFGGGLPPVTLRRTGSGFGSRRLDGVSNVLRVLVFSGAVSTGGRAPERVAVCEFEIDDQTPEDLAVALDRLRAARGVVDVVQAPVLGKKGRLATHVRLLARPEALDAVLDACFVETSTLGVRWHVVDRAVLARSDRVEAREGRDIRVKAAIRPDGSVTEKAEMADLARAGGRSCREGLRRTVERTAEEEAGGA